MGRMRCRLLLVALSLLCLTAFLHFATSPALAQGRGSARRIVVFQEWYAHEAAQAGLLRAHGGEPIQPLRLVRGMSAVLGPAAEAQLSRRPEVLRIDVDAEVHASGGARPPRGGAPPPQQVPWGVSRIGSESAWTTSRGAGAAVAVIDTGIDWSHPDLTANIAGGVNFVRKNLRRPPDPTAWNDDNGHGTHVAGTIAAADNDIGVVGVAPEASLYAVKVLDKNGSGYVSDVVAGIEWTLVNGIDVANMSLGTSVHVQSLQDACNAAAAAGVALVAAAGNSGGAVDYPAAYSSVIAVAATDINDTRPSWSNYGPAIALSAPGVSVLSTWRGGGYATASGTSMAAPHVSGVLALNLRADLYGTADDLPPPGYDIYTGWGLVNAARAVTSTAY